jgi:hypothetical protein
MRLRGLLFCLSISSILLASLPALGRSAASAEPGGRDFHPHRGVNHDSGSIFVDAGLVREAGAPPADPPLEPLPPTDVPQPYAPAPPEPVYEEPAYSSGGGSGVVYVHHGCGGDTASAAGSSTSSDPYYYGSSTDDEEDSSEDSEDESADDSSEDSSDDSSDSDDDDDLGTDSHRVKPKSVRLAPAAKNGLSAASASQCAISRRRATKHEPPVAQWAFIAAAAAAIARRARRKDQ